MERIKLFDTHTHYDDKAYGNNADGLIKRIMSENVSGFMAVGCSMKTTPKAIALAEKYPGVYASAGIHPHYASGLPDDYITLLKKWAENPIVKAIGETGLDYHYEGYSRLKQIECFKEQLSLAEGLNLPVIVHSRDAAQDTMEILREVRPKAVMHCYSGSVEMVRELIGLGILISFTGVITFKNAKKAVEVCREIPLDMIMLETDCPYMAPEPYRGEVCDSSMAWRVADKIAEIKGISVEEVVVTCNRNAERFFNF